ncbi:membrane associated GTPase, partial [Pseudomonas sp. HMWF031]
VRRQLDDPQRVRQSTRQRLLRDLHRQWQAELEGFRRERFRTLLQRSQWIVAGVVAASPVPSVDLLAVAVGNGLMVKEMAKIWSCPWSQDVLQAVVRQLGSAALAQGVVEWSGQALLGLAKLDGASWLAAGAVQALSAAYLTRVVGASMADWMALNAGVAEPDLEELKRQAPLLVSRAAERERLDLSGFADQARDWIRTRNDWITT